MLYRLILIALLGLQASFFSCTKDKAEGDTEASEPREESALKKKGSSCSKFMSDSGGFLYGADDAAAEFGGTWTQELVTQYGCSYNLTSEDKLSGDIVGFRNIGINFGPAANELDLLKHIQQKSAGFSNSEAKMIPQLGDQAFLTTSGGSEKAALHVIKGDKAFRVDCFRMKCPEDRLISVAETVLQNMGR